MHSVFFTLSYSFNSATFYFVLALIQPPENCWSESLSKEDWSLEITEGIIRIHLGRLQWHCNPQPTGKKKRKNEQVVQDEDWVLDG